MERLGPELHRKIGDRLSLLSVPWLGLIFSAGIFLLFAWQSSLMSSFDQTYFREIDDYALHLGIRDLHQSLLNLNFKPWVSTFAYGYGQLFWSLNSFLTLPFYLLKMESAILIFPRLFSCFLILSSCALIARMVREISGSIPVRDICYISLAISPAIGEWAMRLHVNSLQLFLGCLAYFLIFQANRTSKARLVLLSSLALGTSIGCKLTGVFWLPVWGLQFLYFLKTHKKSIAQAVLFSFKNFVVIVLLFIGTAMPLALFSKPAFRNLTETLSYYIKYKNINIGPVINEDVWYSLKGGLFDGYLSWPLFGLLFISCLFWLYKNRKSLLSQHLHFTVFSGVLGLVLVLVYLSLNLKKGPAYFQSYFFSAFPLISVLWVGFAFSLRPLAIKKQLLIFVLLILANFALLRDQTRQLWLRSSLRQESQLYNDYSLMVKEMKPIMIGVRDAQKSLMTVQPPNSMTPLSAFDKDVDVKASAPFGLLGADSCEQGKADFVLFHKQDIPDDKMIAQSIPHEMFSNARDQIQNFFKSGLCGGSAYQKVYDKNDVYVFQKIKK